MPGQNRIGGGALAILLMGASLQGLTGCGGASESATADPAVADYPILYVKRPVPLDDNGNRQDMDPREPAAVHPGGNLYLRDRSKVSSEERNLTGSITRAPDADAIAGDVKDPAVSFDGRRIAFALRRPDPDPNDDEEPTWNIWEYDLDGGALRRVIPLDVVAEEGDDIAPAYLPDGRIVFASNRQRRSRAKLLDDGKPQYSGLDEDRNEPAFVLHVMNANGGSIEQITFNQSHDLDPAVLDNGRILFVRWDNMGGRDGMHLYTASPDGSDLQLLYGAQSHDTGTGNTPVEFLSPQPLANGHVMTLVRPFTGTDFGGDLVDVSAGSFVEVNQPTAPNQGLINRGQRSATDKSVSTEPGPSTFGRFSAFYPLYDGTGRLLVGWSPCFVVDDAQPVPCQSDNLDLPAAAPRYGLWVYEPGEGTQMPVVLGSTSALVTDAVVARARRYPAPAPEVAPDDDFVREDVGILEIRSVYDVDGVDTANPDIDTLADPSLTPAAQRPAWFLRIVKAVPIPDDEVYDFANTAFGRSAGQLMREIIGYVPIEPDGSVRAKVPANVPLAISVTDADGRRISSRHRGWLQVRPGETLSCNGCHDPASGLSHGRDTAFNAVHDGLAVTGGRYPGTVTPGGIPTDAGWTMARIAYDWVRNDGDDTNDGRSAPSVDPYFEDIWTDPSAATPAAALDEYSYNDLDTPAPTADRCLPNPVNPWETNWDAGCRVVINFPEHIQPIWGFSRDSAANAQVTASLQGLAANSVQMDQNNLPATFSCTSCHRPEDAMGNAAVPADQLDLRGVASDQEPDYYYGYQELFFPDNEQEVSGGVLVDTRVETGECQTNGDGEPIDETGAVVDDPAECAPETELVPVQPVMSVNGALASPGFFDLFDAGGSHEGLLTPAELRLVAEWVDIGGQYYNNPFDAPEN